MWKECAESSGSVRLRMDPGRLAGIAEIAEMLRVSKHTAVRYSARRDFPTPLERLASGPVWRTEDVERWSKEHLPLPRGRTSRDK
jgi:predicted DNA-binding transcriptional regulator AlpA